MFEARGKGKVLGLSWHPDAQVPRKVYSAQFIGCLQCARLESKNTKMKTTVMPCHTTEYGDFHVVLGGALLDV